MHWAVSEEYAHSTAARDARAVLLGRCPRDRASTSPWAGGGYEDLAPGGDSRLASEFNERATEVLERWILTVLVVACFGTAFAGTVRLSSATLDFERMEGNDVHEAWGNPATTIALISLRSQSHTPSCSRPGCLTAAVGAAPFLATKARDAARRLPFAIVGGSRRWGSEN